MDITLIDSISEVSRDEWNLLTGTDYPFMRYEFLHALENSGSVCERSGWVPQHCLVYRDKELAGLMPMYRKTHSQGEYVFDHDWACAYEHHGLAYYPKWLTSIPFTPCEGKRIVAKKDPGLKPVYGAVLGFLKEKAVDCSISSWHCLFPVPEEVEYLRTECLCIREGVQFRWFNAGYRDFQDFLETFNAKKRKSLKRERRHVEEQKIELWTVPGPEISESQWQAFFQFYRMTYMKRLMPSYLNFSFFRELAETMADQLLLVLAVKENTYVGAALSFIGSDTLYGRYWGCFEEHHSLHFEACYYQGLEYCIKNKLQRFDSGAQGEHKIARGFEPVTTYSAHWLKDPRFATAIGDFVTEEAKMMDHYKSDAVALLPFKKR
ncbi:MAG: GNAT family N-acetyltransferase [Gammaproteobacteria bacterium]